MRLKEDDESKIEEVKDAAERIREDLKEAARKQEEAAEKNEKNM
jgi:DNA-directed RNA polymerase subunit L